MSTVPLLRIFGFEIRIHVSWAGATSSWHTALVCAVFGWLQRLSLRYSETNGQVPQFGSYSTTAWSGNSLGPLPLRGK